MFLLKMMMILFMIVSMILLSLNFFLSKKISNREKSSPFECGFEPLTPSRLPFSMQFFLISIIFLIFDIEIIIFLPLISALILSKYKLMTLTLTLFILILLISLFIEWKDGALMWMM